MEGKNSRFTYVEIPGGGHDNPLAKKYFDVALEWALKEIAE